MARIVRVRRTAPDASCDPLAEALDGAAEIEVATVDPAEPSNWSALFERLRDGPPARWVFEGTEAVASHLLGLGLCHGVIMPDEATAAARADAFFRRFVTFQFATFSFRLHTRLQRLRLSSAIFKYWPAVQEGPGPSVSRPWSASFRPSAGGAAASRTSALRTVAAQCRQLGIDRLIVFASGMPELTTARTEIMTLVDGPDTRGGRAADLFFFAEAATDREIASAMARGQIVVAPRVGDASERIGHLASGLTFQLHAPTALPAIDEAMAQTLSTGAARKARFGRQEWVTDRNRLASIILDDGRRWGSADPSATFVNRLHRAARTRRVADLR